MKETLKLGAILLMFAVIAAAVLGFTNQITKPIISEREKRETEAAYNEIIPEADEFISLDDAQLKSIQENHKKVVSIVKAMKDGKLYGVLFTSVGGGYGGNITVMTGVVDGNIASIKILKHSETPQIGTKIEEPGFQEKYSGLSAQENVNLVTTKKEAQDVEKITGSTVSSRGVTAAVNAVIDCYKEISDEL